MTPEIGRASLIIARHGRPDIQPDTPPPEWSLDERGRAASRALGRALEGFGIAAAISSPEPKAFETMRLVAGPLGIPLTTDADLGEHRRETWDFASQERQTARVHAVLTGPSSSVEGAETGALARARFARALDRRPERPLLVGTHGTIMSLYLAPLLKADPVDFWSSLGFAEALALDEAGVLIARINGEALAEVG
jgi:broad specificity phosphatase PhoE